MLSRERVLAAMNFAAVDVPPLRILPAAGGFFDHGQKLVDLIKATGHDFGPLDSLALPPPIPLGDYDAAGHYHAFRTDEWGTRWEYLTPGVWGCVAEYPLADFARLDDYRVPAAPVLPDDAERERAARHRKQFFLLADGGSLFEQMQFLRPFEQVVVEIFEDDPRINRLADLVADRCRRLVERAAALGADGVILGDDFGTQQACILPPRVWRRFFRPRYEHIFQPARQGGLKIFFHSCGQIDTLLEDFAALGVNAIWPQLTLWRPGDLVRRCRSLGMAVELHPDRGDLMQHGSPTQVRDYVRRLIDECATLQGGSILYLEVDPNFPWPNVVALFETAAKLRAMGS
ncbi:MAG: uroporphyrinogen decarboxylase family protein [Phycisphaerae bacterium]|nr:uroporphyrinogen decarboxylase family protein [Phycisphaerae bacterium]